MWYGLIILSLLLLGLAVFSFRFAWWAPAVDYRHPRVLMYHLITANRPGQKQRGLRVAPASFERQLAWLKQNGWTFLTMSELVKAGGKPPVKSVVLTFDDGFEDNFTTAFPLLKRYDAKATLYLVIDRHDRDWSVYKKAHHDSGELARVPKLSDDQVREMVASGVWELGGHTRTHLNLAKAGERERTDEIAGCRALLQETFGCEVTSFAYPFGIYSATDVVAVEAAGYTSAVTTVPGIDPVPWVRPLELKRVKISGKDGLLAFKIRMKRGRKGVLK